MPRQPRTASTNAALNRSVYDVLAQRARLYPGRVFRLNVGDTWRDPLAAARSESQRTAEHERLHCYAATQGEPALLDAIEADLARRGPKVARDAIQVVAGATVGLSVTCQALLDPGDEVLLLAPYWPLIPGIVASRGARPVEVPLYTRMDEPGFDIVALLEERVTPRTVALYLNTPNNPTGRVLSESQLLAVGAVAERHGLWILSDEVYEDLWFGREHPSAAWTLPSLEKRVIAVHSASKTYGLAGTRVGWAHGPVEAMRDVRAVHVHQVYGAARPMQLGAARALTGGVAWVSGTRKLYAEAAAKAAAALGAPVPEAGTFVFVDAEPWLDGAATAMPLLERLADAGVLLTPGSASGPSYARYLRLCYTCVPPDELDEALERIRTVLA